MEMPKPHAWPAWRVVLTDFVIVVLGVGVALAAQQAAEWWHWRGEVAVARAALQEEIASTNRFYVLRIAYAPCAARQEREARDILDRLEARGQPMPFTAFHHSLGTTMSDSEWQSQRSSQVLPIFPMRSWR